LRLAWSNFETAISGINAEQNVHVIDGCKWDIFLDYIYTLLVSKAFCFFLLYCRMSKHYA